MHEEALSWKFFLQTTSCYSLVFHHLTFGVSSEQVPVVTIEDNVTLNMQVLYTSKSIFFYQLLYNSKNIELGISCHYEIFYQFFQPSIYGYCYGWLSGVQNL